MLRLLGKSPSPPDASRALLKPLGRILGAHLRVSPPAPAESILLEETQTPVQEPAPAAKPFVKLSNGKWLASQGKLGHAIEASVDAALPDNTAATRILFTGYHILPNGRRDPDWKFQGEAHVREGKAVCSLTLPEIKDAAGQSSAKALFHFTAKHRDSEEYQGPNLEAVPGPPVTGLECLLYFSPIRREYLHIDTPEDFKTLQDEADRLEPLLGQSRHALIGDDESKPRKLRNLAEEAEALFEGGLVGDAKGVLEEMVLVRQNPRWGKAKAWIYIPSDKKAGSKAMGRRRKANDKLAKEIVDDLLKKAPGNKEASPLLSGELSLKLFKIQPKAGQPLAWYSEEKTGEIAGKAFTFSKEATVCRFAYGFEGEATTDLKKRKIALGISGSLTYGLLEGSMRGEIPCPENGLNLLECLHGVKGLDGFLKRDRKCLVRLNVILGTQAFAGLSIAGALSFPHIDLSKEKPGKRKVGEAKKAELGGTFSGVLGFQGNESLAVVPEWSPTHSPAKFSALGQAQVEIGVTVGLAGEARAQVDYAGGKFRFKLGAGAALGVGPRGGVQFEVSLEEGWQLVGHLLNSVDYRYVGEISQDAFEAYKNYAFTLLVEGKAAGVAVAGEIIGDFKGWLERTKDQLNKFKESLAASSVYGATLARTPPEALGQALLTLMKTREATDFKPILWILHSTVRRDAEPLPDTSAEHKPDPSADHKLKWTLRAVSGRVVTREDDTGKEKALREGIRIIRDFGEAGGPWAGEKDQSRNMSFLNQFEKLLRDNGMRL